VVADALADANSDRELNEKEFISKAMKLGEEYRLMGKVSADSVSTVAFRQALALAGNRGLLNSGPTAATTRRAFAEEVRRVIEARGRLGDLH
jgi:hypothetical protein